jgi:hypothetical protein
LVEQSNAPGYAVTLEKFVIKNFVIKNEVGEHASRLPWRQSSAKLTPRRFGEARIENAPRWGINAGSAFAVDGFR